MLHTMKKYLTLLSRLWLSEHSGKIYITLLEYGKSSIADIVRYSSLHRIEVYRELPWLLDIDLVREVKVGKRKVYQAANPEKIEELFENIKVSSEIVIQELKEKYLHPENRPTVTYREWKKWVTAVFHDIVTSLKKWEVFYRVSSEVNVDMANAYLPLDYRKKRDAKELERYVIMGEKAASKKKPRAERELVILPKGYEQFEQNVSMTIFSNKIAFIDFSTETSITIENKQLAEFQKILFKGLFKSLRKK